MKKMKFSKVLSIILIIFVVSVLLISNCTSKTQRMVKQQYGLHKVLAIYSCNKTTSEVVMDEIEARINKMIKIKNSGNDNYMEMMILNIEVQSLLQSPDLPSGDYVPPQLKRIEAKMKQLL